MRVSETDTRAEGPEGGAGGEQGAQSMGRPAWPCVWVRLCPRTLLGTERCGHLPSSVENWEAGAGALGPGERCPPQVCGHMCPACMGVSV